MGQIPGFGLLSSGEFWPRLGGDPVLGGGRRAVANFGPTLDLIVT
jgi:hypothetical protein